MIREHMFSASAKVAAVCVAGLVLILSLPSGVAGQGSTPQRGYQPGASYALSDIETINTDNGNLLLNLPMGKLPPGRGGLSGQLNLHYSSKLYDSKTQYYEDFEHLEPGGQPHVVLRNMLVTSDQGGWHYGTGYSLQLIDRISQYPGQPPPFPANENIYHWKVKVAFPDGSLHEFLPRGFGAHMQDGYYDIRPDGWQTRWAPNGTAQDYPYLTNTLTYYTFDGTYVRLDIQHDSNSDWSDNPWTLHFPDGTKVTNNGNRITDRNGNYVEFSNITYNGHFATQLIDQLGRKLIIEYGGGNGPDVIHAPGVGGVNLTYQVHWKTIQVYKTHSTVLDQYGQYPEMLGLQPVVSEIDLPAESGGLKYVFGYNAADSGSVPCCTPSYGWGELNSITTPTGAQAQYQYQMDGQNGPGMQYMWDVVLKKRITRKSLTYQQQYDGSSTPVTETWNYPATGNNDNIASIVNPDGGIVTLGVDQQRNYRTDLADGTVIEKLWQANVPQGFPVHYVPDEFGVNAYDPGRANSYVKTEFTSIRDASGNLTKTAIKDYSYDKNGNVTSVREYDWVDYSSVSRGGVFPYMPTGIPGSAVLKRVATNTFARATPDASDSNSNHADSYWNSSSPNIKTALASTEVSNGSVTLSRAELFYDDPATTGNLIQQKSWDSTKGGYSNPLSSTNSIAVSHQYDGYGNPILTTDARGIQTQLHYGNVGGFTDLYPTQIKTAYQTSVQRTETREYDFSTGLVTRVTDVDNNVSSSTNYDVFGRPVLVKAAEGKPEETRTATEYSDVLRRIIVRSDLSNLGDGKLVDIQHFDQLGRVRLSRTLEDAATQSATDETKGIKVQTRYVVSNPCQPANTSACLAENAASLASYQMVSNPYRADYSTSAGSESTMGWIRSKSDNGGRLINVQTFGGAGLPAPWGPNTASTGAVTTAYDANFTTVSDQAGKVRRSMTDGLGRLTRVDEPDGNGNLGATTAPVQATNYTYDLSNLISVVQGLQTRSFTYSSLGRLTSAINPESGMICYGAVVSGQCQGNGYDANGNLTQKTDARNVVTDYAYDALNRNISVIYSDGTPSVYRYYDMSQNGKGLFSWQDTTGVSANVIDIYDALGRPKQYRQRFWVNGDWGDDFKVTVSYNKSGQILTQEYPSERTVSYSYDGAGRLQSFTGNLGDDTQRTYAGEFQYTVWNSLQQEKFGTDTATYHKQRFNSRGQLWDMRASTVSFSADPANGDRGSIVNYYSNNFLQGESGADNNGNLLRQETHVPASNFYQDNFDYDALNRLTSVAEKLNGAGTETFKQSYTYDRWGNRTIDGNPSKTWGANINSIQMVPDQNTNRMYAPNDPAHVYVDYDAAGNQTKDYLTSNGTRAFDAENRMKSAINNGIASTYTYDGGGQRIKRKVNGVETWQVYALGGELLAEYAANGAASSPQKEYGYRNGQLLITAEPAAGTNVALAANGATATGSSTLSSYVAGNVVDGSRRAINNTAWLDNTLASFPDWIEVSFNGSKTISEIDVVTQQDDYQNLVEPGLSQTFSLYGITAFDVQYWNGSAWVTVTGGSVTGNNKVWRQLSFSPVTTSKIRVVVNAGADNTYCRVVEVEAWEAPTPPVNVALGTNGGTATGSSTLSSYVAGNVVNGSRQAINNTAWLDNTAVSFPDWIEVSFNGSKTISEIDVITQQDDYQNLVEPTLSQTFSLYGITAFDVQYWNGSAWQTVPNGSVTGNNKVWRQFSFSPVTTSKIRVVVSAGADNTYCRVVEVEAWTASTGAAQLHWLVTDQLGTPRIILDQTGSLANVGRHDYLPFGEEVPGGFRNGTPGYATGDNVRQKFTLKERDNETGLDYFGARYYASTQGRFTSPDDFLNDTHANDPSWNLYTYVRNNPLKYIDPFGEEVYGTDLSEEQRQKLIDDWRKKTGYGDIQFKDGKLIINTEAGRSGGSAKAAEQLLAAATSTSVRFNLASVDTTKVAFAEVSGGRLARNERGQSRFDFTVKIDFGDFDRVGGDKEAKEAYSVGIVTIHEFDHKVYDIRDKPNGRNDPGPLENIYINPIRRELGLAERLHYLSEPVSGGSQQIRFKISGKEKVLRWRHDLVGGKVK